MTEPTVDQVREALAGHAGGHGEVTEGEIETTARSEHWEGRLSEVLRIIGADIDTARYVSGGSRPDEIAATAALWSETALTTEEIELIVRGGGYDPDPFVILSRQGLLRSALCEEDGSYRHVNGERAGAWISDQLNSASPEEIVERTKTMIADTDRRATGAPG